jgi:hypothetical protein
MIYPERAATPANMAKEVARCSALLRQMYALDLQIWGMGAAVGEDIQRRENMQYRANALFREIRRMVNDWIANPGARWSGEEQQQIEEIWSLVDQHDPTRY